MLTAEQIQANWDKFLGYIETYISEPRKQKLLNFYKKYEERIIMMPASHKKEYHNSFPGGYVDHVIRVIQGALTINQAWQTMRVVETYTTEELIFSAINHDLGKIGSEEFEAYIPQTDQWRKEKLGEEYTHNTQIDFMTVPDRGLYLLQTHGIDYTKNEYLAIKLHDGLYDEANKPYLISWMPETKLRTSLPFIVHQADLMAARIEWEWEWLPKLSKPKVSNFTLKTPSQVTKTNHSNTKISTKSKALSATSSEGLNKAIDNFFN